VRCTACGAPGAPNARFCDQCGAPREPVARESAARARDLASPPPELPTGDRRIVSALFADLVDYSRMVAELDPEDVRRRVDAAFDAMAQAIERFDGTLEKFIGDAVFAVFGAPRAHDDDAVRAAVCAVAMRADLARIGGELGEGPFEVRIGIATGEVVAAPRRVAGQTTWALTGEAVTVAARLQQLADPGEILVDEATVRAARHRLDAEPAGSQLLRGHPDPVRLYRLRSIRPPRLVAPAGAGLLIGRAEERRQLRDALEATRESGRGRVVLIDGEAGIGKSRLIADLEEEARADGFAWTWTENVSYSTGEPYGYARLFAERVAEELGTDPGLMTRQLLFEPDVRPETIRRYASAVAAIAREAAFSGWEAEQLLVPADPREVAARLLEVAARFAIRLAELYGPRVVVVDDYHWLDRSSIALADALIRAVATLPFLVLVTRRPAPLPAWAGLPHVELIVLRGLDPAETGRLAASLAGGDLDPRDVRRLHERTAGNPLFVGETIRALLEEGALDRRHGRLAILDRLAERPIPVSLRALLGARIDALPDDARIVLQVASVIGMSFAEELVAELLGRRVTSDALERLVGGALVVPGEGPRAWRFGHPLIHDVTYAGILASRRRELHTRLADALTATRPAVPVGQLAHHRAAAGDRAAVPLLTSAAEEALAIGAAREAAEAWRAAARLLGDDPGADEFRRRADEIIEPAPTG